jgi:hypothetical protein
MRMRLVGIIAGEDHGAERGQRHPELSRRISRHWLEQIESDLKTAKASLRRQSRRPG